MPPILTQLPSQYQPLVDAPTAPDLPPPLLRKDESNAACPSNNRDLKRYFLTATDDMIFGVYQDWVPQNPGTHLDSGI